jgi:hypothetical protein
MRTSRRPGSCSATNRQLGDAMRSTLASSAHNRRRRLGRAHQDPLQRHRLFRGQHDPRRRQRDHRHRTEQPALFPAARRHVVRRRRDRYVVERDERPDRNRQTPVSACASTHRSGVAGLDLTDVGFLRRADQTWMSNWFQIRSDKPNKWFRSRNFNINQWATWNYDGDRLFSART